MSKANVESTRRGFQAFNERNLDALLDLVDEDVEIFPVLAEMEGGFHGYEGILRWWATLLETFPTFHVEVLEVQDLGEMTFSCLRLRGRGVVSDTPVDTPAWHVSRFRDGKCVRWQVFTSEAAAREAAGL